MQQELENGNRMTTDQTSKSRLVTKCRFIVEKKIGELKRFHALVKRRNTEVGHLQLDYRIACAMLNYLHKPCNSDEKKNEDAIFNENRTTKLADRLLKKCQNSKTSILENILSLRLGTAAVPKVKLDDVFDFPKLSKATMVSKLFYGKYYMKQAKSYLADFIKTGWVSRIEDVNLKNHLQYAEAVKSIDFEKTRILGMQMISRHRRALTSLRIKDIKNPEKKQREKGNNTITKKQAGHIKTFKNHYQIFVQYIPNLNRSRSILCEFFDQIRHKK